MQEAERSSVAETMDFASLQYVYRSTLQIESESFQGTWQKSKAEAKKYVAQMAWEFYNRSGNPFFTKASMEKLVSYTNKLNQLCASLQIPLPHFILKGFNSDSLGPFIGECYVAGKSFRDSQQYSKKLQAKEAIAKLAFMELKKDLRIKACLEKKQAYKIDPNELQQQFRRHFVQGSSNQGMASISQDLGSVNSSFQDSFGQEQLYTGVKDSRQYYRGPDEQNSRDWGKEKSHFTYSPERNNDYSNVPTPNFDDLVVGDETLTGYKMAPIREPFYNDPGVPNHDSYYKGPNMWHTQPSFGSCHASPFGYVAPDNIIKPEQPDLVVVFDRKSKIENGMERRNDLEDYANWSSRSERPLNHRAAGPSYDFPEGPRGPSRSRERDRSFSRSPPSHRSRHHRSRSRSLSRSRSSGQRSRRKKRRNSSLTPPLSIPANIGKYGTLIYEMAIQNPGLGTPHFSIRPSPFIVNEVIAQLAIGHKAFLSADSHLKEIEAIEDVAKIAHEELTRMLEISKKMNQYKIKSDSNQTGEKNSHVTSAQLHKDLSSSGRKENIYPISNNATKTHTSLNKPIGDSLTDKEISKEETMLYYNFLPDDMNFISLEPAPRNSFTEKFKRVDDRNKKNMIDTMRKKRENYTDDRDENITRVAVGKVKGEEYSDEE